MEDKNYIENRAWLEEQRCPKCGAPMERGYVFGHWFNLRWSNKPKNITIFAGTPLRKKIS